MRITINDKQKILGNQAIQKTEEKVSAAFSKFGHHILSIEITVEDINGPRGGVDQECRIRINMRKSDDIVASIKDASLSQAISRCVDRAQRSVIRKIQRRMYRESNRRSNFGIAME